MWIVEAPAWDYSADSTAISNADPLRAVTLNIPTANFIEQPLLIAGYTVDQNGIESPDGDGPIREDWIFGDPPLVTQVSEDTTLTPQAQTCEADATADAFTITLAPFSEWLGFDITIVKVDGSTNAITWQTSSPTDVVAGLGTSGQLTTQGQWITITATQA